MNPVYLKMKAAADQLGRAPYMDTADVAKCIRATLKLRFPGTTFSTRISRYSGGSSVRVAWTDGPTTSMVEEVTGRFEGKGFDGMIDLAYYKDIFLLPDGSAEFASTEGTEGSMGTVPAASAWKPSPDAIRVRPSCYVFEERSYSADTRRKALQSYAAKWDDELAEAIRNGLVSVKEDGRYSSFTGTAGIRVADGWADQALYRHMSRRATVRAA